MKDERSADSNVMTECWFPPLESSLHPGQMWGQWNDSKVVTTATAGPGRCRASGIYLPTSDIWSGPRLSHGDLRRDRSSANLSAGSVPCQASLGLLLRDKEAV